MKLIARPTACLKGEIYLPGDKSISHRAALLGALAEGESCLENFLVSGVTRPILTALRALRVVFELNETTLTIRSAGLDGLISTGKSNRTTIDDELRIDVGNSATSLRLLAGVLAAAGRPATLDGSQGLRRRPMQRIITPLGLMGVPIASENGCAPLQLFPDRPPAKGTKLKAIHYQLPVASAQVKSCLLLAALAAHGTTTLVEPGPSRDHTERLLRGMGLSIQTESLELEPGYPARVFITSLTPPSRLQLPSLRMEIPGDFSSAGFLIVAALVTPESEIVIKNVGLNPTRTGLLEVLQAMGGEIQINQLAERHGEPVGDLTVRSSHLSGVEVSGELVVRMIDEFPIFAIAAAYASGLSRVRDAHELRLKESDRIAALCQRLRALGIQVEESTDGFCIQGGTGFTGGVVDSAGDHRLAMAFAVAGLAAREEVAVADAEYIAESFPQFVGTLSQLGANLVAQE